MPVHRNLDLSILFLASISVDESAHYPKSNLREEIDIPKDVKIKDYYKDNKPLTMSEKAELQTYTSGDEARKFILVLRIPAILI